MRNQRLAMTGLARLARTGLARLKPTSLATLLVLAGGLLLGAPVVLAAIPEAPVVESEGVSAVSATTATPNAQVNPGGQKTQYTFQYATNKALTGAKAVGGASELEGTEGQSVSVALLGLEGGGVYYYRVIASNATGTSEGVVQSFTTPPVPTTSAPSEVTGTSAVFSGEFALNPVDTDSFFEYARGSVCPGEDSTPPVSAGTGTSPTTVSWEAPSAEVPGPYPGSPALYPSTLPLHPDSQYTVCLVTQNAYGSDTGPEVHFTTPPTPPAVDGESVGYVHESVAWLQAIVDPNLQETSYGFEYSMNASGQTLEGAVTTVNGAAPLAAELKDLTASAELEGLAPDTTYYYRVVAQNATPLTQEGPVQTLLTPPLTGGASTVTTSTATIAGTIDPSSGLPPEQDTTYFFEYGPDTAYGQQTPVEDPSEGTGPTVETAALSGLTPGGTYHYRVVAVNNDNGGAPQLAYGEDETFTTQPMPPEASTGEAREVSATTATLTGTINRQGRQATYEIDYDLVGYAGCNPEAEAGYRVQLDSETAPGSVISVDVSGLLPGTVYHYRTAITTAQGTACGTVAAFTTRGTPLSTPAATSTPLLRSLNAEPASKQAVVKSEAIGPPKAKTLTRTQKLAGALKACHSKPKGAKRSACERAARKRYPPPRHTAKKKTTR